MNARGSNNPVHVSAWVMALSLALYVQSPALARPDVPQGSSVWSAASTPLDVASTLPDSVDLVIVVDRARELRASRLGALVQERLKASGMLDPLMSAWSELAQQLKLGPDESFDRLVGRRVVLVSRSQGPRPAERPDKEAGGDRSWAILSLVDVATERLLFERLQAAPRGIAQGHQILALERGRYELTSHRVKGENAEPESSVIVLGPSAQSGLFDDLIAALANGAKAPLGQRGVIEQARSGKGADAPGIGAPAPCEVLMLAGLDVASEALSGPQRIARPQTNNEWSNFVLMTSGRERASTPTGVGDRGESWRARVVVRQESKRDALLRIPESGDALARSISRDDETLGASLLSIVQCAPLEPVLGNTLSILDLTRVLNVPGQNDQPNAHRRIVSLRAVPGEKSGQSQEPNRPMCTVGVEVSDRDAAAVEIDRATARTVGLIEERFNPSAPRPLDFGGVAPDSPRVLPIRIPAGSLPFGLGVEVGDVGAGGVGGGGGGGVEARPIVLSWAFPRVTGQEGPAGWWVLGGAERPSPSSGQSNSFTSAQLLSREIAKITRPGGEDVRGRWVWLGTGRPSALEALVPPALPDFAGVRSAMKRVERFEARLGVSQAGDVIGDVGMTLVVPGTEPAKGLGTGHAPR